MKAKILVPMLCLLAGAAHAAFENWTNKEGRTASLELVSVEEVDGEKIGHFRQRNGRAVTLKASDLAEADAARLAAWEAAAPEGAAEGPKSVFDRVLERNIVQLQGRRLVRTELTKPEKYYVFYYTASWCGPCQAYTPGLVDFYNAAKEGNSKFELILISSDRDEGAMTEYAVDKKMPWPQLRMSQVPDFRRAFDHGVSGIPAVIVCDLEGNIVSRSRSIAELEALLK